MNLIESPTVEIIKGNLHVLDIEIFDKNQDPIDLSSCTVTLTVKRNPNDSDSEAVLAVDTSVHVDAQEGVTQITLTPEITEIEAGSYFYDLKVLSPGNGISSIRYGRFRVIQNVG